MNLSPLFLVLMLLIMSGVVGMPLAAYFLGRNGTTKLLALAVVLGFGLIHLAVFFATLVLRSGTDKVALPTLMVLMALALLFFMLPSSREMLRSLRTSAKTWIGLLSLFLIAGSHVLLPVILGYWEMAYATGDDASRWYMVVNYFRTEVFEYWKVTGDTLQWRLGERPLQNISGALIASLFHTTSAIAYSLSSAAAAIVAAFSLLFLFETWFGEKNDKNRWFAWVLIALFFGFFGAFTNIYYTGRTTHHFSLYPVIAALGFVGVVDKGLRRWLWFALWCVLLAYCYSIRFSVNFVVLAGFIIFSQWICKEIVFRRAVVNVLALATGLSVACVAAYGELKVILESMGGSSGFLLMQRGADYGADGTTLDRILKWSGFLGTYDSHESVRLWMLIIGLSLIFLVVGIALIQAAWSFRTQPSYAGLLVFNIVLATFLFASKNYYVAWKISLYWPAYVFVGFLGFASNLYYSATEDYKRRAGLYLMVLAVLYIGVTGRQLLMYKEMVEDRVTKVDQQSYEMVSTLKTSLRDCPQCTSLIYGFDYSAERHLLLREIFRDFDWQPLRGKELNFENDIIRRRTPEQMDQYHYTFLLYANTFKCEPFDFSGNRDSLLYDNYPFQIFGPRSSLLEPISGIEIRMYGPYDEIRHCPVYGGEMTDPAAKLVFANNGAHSWLDLTIRVYGGGMKSLGQILTFTATAGRSTIDNLGKTDDYSEYRVHLYELQDDRLVRLSLVRRGEGKIILTQAKWGR